MTTTAASNDLAPAKTPFMGLAPFLRMSIAGEDLRPLNKELLEQAGRDATDAALWMNLSISMQCIGEQQIGLDIQQLALQQQRVYRYAAAQQPARLRLLVLTSPGEIGANTPLDCLLEDSDIDLLFYYITPGEPLAAPIPEHDAVFVSICASDENRAVLAALERALADWPKPVIDAPQHIPATGREEASKLLQGIPGLLIPPTFQAGRAVLQDIAGGRAALAEQIGGCDFPIIARPVGSHAGRDLDRIGNAQELAAYLGKVECAEFFVSPFIDYSNPDGLFRKFRIALVDGAPYACHMGVSSNWMIHYVNAGMYEDAQKRSEELAFMEGFDDFRRRHGKALDAIYRRTQLDYLCIDCAETQAGELLIFEIDHTMVVHAMDTAELFPYKQVHMLKVKNAFREFLLRLTGK